MRNSPKKTTDSADVIVQSVQVTSRDGYPLGPAYKAYEIVALVSDTEYCRIESACENGHLYSVAVAGTVYVGVVDGNIVLTRVSDTHWNVRFTLIDCDSLEWQTLKSSLFETSR